MNVPNILTLLRIVLGFIVPMLLLYGDMNSRIIAAVLFTIAGVTDYLDGWYARKYNLVTKLGAILDPIADKIILLGCFIVLSSFTDLNVFSYWWVIPIFLREVLITIVRLVFLTKKKPLVVAASWSGKAKTIMQFITLPVAYFIFMFRTYGPVEPSAWMDYVLLALLISSVAFTLQSGWSFFSKNWKHL
ncbi:MAG: CDP-diacylglycerol--glycerol-3-phosphate 3-phosphatidyltransferase [Saprospiraceae bacterium]|nr:CDP-diacylglycerol--glycerol-3-phosphate 3-phosphatidyltransferase [Saprospiraceae bacterium]